jgi:hypothetical protein
MVSAARVISARSRNQWVSVTPLNVSEWYLDALKTISELGGLPNNWDGYGSPMLHEEARIIAVQVLSLLAWTGADAPHIAPVPGGGLQFEWDVADRSLELEVLPSGEIEFLVTMDNGWSREGPITSKDKQIPFLTKWLRTGYYD